MDIENYFLSHLITDELTVSTVKYYPKISVCMATYNGSLFIREQLISILNQISQEDEVVISDDSSSDNTVAVIRELNDKRIIILENQNFGSPIYNFENALKQASGDIIFMADQDDIWASNKVEVCLTHLQNFDLIVSDCTIINNDKEVLEESFYNVNNSGRGILRNLYKNSYIGCCMAFNRKVLRKSLPFPTKLPMHDSWIGLVADFCFRTIFVQEKLVFYRRHESNASSTGYRSTRNWRVKLRERFTLSTKLILRCFAI